MNSFNKLYKLILESVITQNKQYRQSVMKKALYYYNKQDTTTILNFLDSLNNNKLADFLVKFFATGEIKDCKDPKIDKVKEILKAKSSIDTQGFKGNLDQFIQTYYREVEFKQEKKSAKTISYLDSIPQFSQKKEYDNGVVIYRVEDTKEGMKAVRKVVDLQWGTDANPWCLITPPLNTAWDYWKNYSAYPKHIAFQKGKLLAFSASNRPYTEWWDRQDHNTSHLVLSNGQLFRTPEYNWTQEQINQKFIKKFKLVFNEETKRWDCAKTVVVKKEDLIQDLHRGYMFPFPFGEIKGDFRCHDTPLQTLYNGPTKVGGSFVVKYNTHLTSLEYGPTYVGKDYDVSRCKKLQSAKGKAKYIGGEFKCAGCQKLPITDQYGLIYNEQTGRWDSNKTIRFSNKDIIKGHFPCKLGVIKGNFICESCSTLKSLQNGPIRVEGDCHFSWLHITSLEGAPEYVGKDFICAYAQWLTTLKGCPKYVGGNFRLTGGDRYNVDFEGFESKDLPEYVGGNFECHHLKDVEHLPKNLKGDIDLEDGDMISLKGCPEVVNDYFSIMNCRDLKSLEGGPKIVKGTFDCRWCESLTSWKGAPEEVGTNFCYDSKMGLKLKKNIPTKVKGRIIEY